MRFTHGYVSAGRREITQTELSLLRERGSRLCLDAFIYGIFFVFAIAAFVLGAQIIQINIFAAGALLVVGCIGCFYLVRQIRSHYVLGAGFLRAARDGHVERFERASDDFLASIIVAEKQSPHWEDVAERIQAEFGRTVKKFDIVAERKQIVLMEGALAKRASFIEVLESKSDATRNVAIPAAKD